MSLISVTLTSEGMIWEHWPEMGQYDLLQDLHVLFFIYLSDHLVNVWRL